MALVVGTLKKLFCGFLKVEANTFLWRNDFDNKND